MPGKTPMDDSVATQPEQGAIIPKHIAIIMDGNGRWAKKRSLPRIIGHREGIKVVRNVVIKCSELGVEALTLYAFSTENWKRPKSEVDFLMRAPEKFLFTYLPELIENNVRVQTMGDQQNLPNHTLKAIRSAMEKTRNNTGMVLNFAWNYGSRYEITEAVRHLAQDVKDEHVAIEDINENLLSDYMFSRRLGDPDLLIRTSGEIRLSNFMLWQLAYTELWFTDVLWPDFKEAQLLEAIEEFGRRGRRFGNV